MTLVFSIGHSNHDWGTFKRLLETANIGTVADVRSSPASRLPHFDRAALKDRLNTTGIAYVFLGSELGGRPKDGGIPDYEVMAASPLFAEGIAHVEEIAPRTRLGTHVLRARAAELPSLLARRPPSCRTRGRSRPHPAWRDSRAQRAHRGSPACHHTTDRA
jgi:hypothetical protein